MGLPFRSRVTCLEGRMGVVWGINAGEIGKGAEKRSFINNDNNAVKFINNDNNDNNAVVAAAKNKNLGGAVRFSCSV